MQNASDHIFLTTKQVLARYQISTATLWRWENDPAVKFPSPLKVGHKKLYAQKSLEAWEAARMAVPA